MFLRLKIFTKLKNLVDLECNFFPPDESNDSYGCVVEDLPVNSILIVTNVIGTHEEGKSNADVKSLEFLFSIWAFLPSGIENFFPNISDVRIGVSLTSISASDLKSFPKLTTFTLNNNRIQRLPGDLFRHNLFLEIIEIEEYEIVDISDKIFDSLEKLKKVTLKKNECFVKATSKKEIIGIVQKFKTQCL